MATATIVLVDNLWLVRGEGAPIQLSLLTGMLLLAIPAGALGGLGIGAHRLAATRLAAGEGARAGSAIKVAVLFGLLGGVLAAVAGVQLAMGPMAALFPVPQSGALFVYRAGVALPAVGAAVGLAAGLLLVERPRALAPALGLLAIVDVVMAERWLHRGSAVVGYELSGPGLALPVALLLGTVMLGALLVAGARGRSALAIHKARPLHPADLRPLLRASAVPAGALAGAAALAVAALTLMARDEVRLDAVVAAGAALALVAGLAVTAELLERDGGGWPGWVAMGALAAGSLLALAAPGAPSEVLAPSLGYGGASLLAVRLVGGLGLVELALLLLARVGWLGRRSSPWGELLALAIVAVLLGAMLLVAGRLGLASGLLALLIARAATAPAARLR